MSSKRLNQHIWDCINAAFESVYVCPDREDDWNDYLDEIHTDILRSGRIDCQQAAWEWRHRFDAAMEPDYD